MGRSIRSSSGGLSFNGEDGLLARDGEDDLGLSNRPACARIEEHQIEERGIEERAGARFGVEERRIEEDGVKYAQHQLPLRVQGKHQPELNEVAEQTHPAQSAVLGALVDQPFVEGGAGHAAVSALTSGIMQMNVPSA